MTPLEFVTTYRPQAEAVSAGTGIDVDVLLAQWALECAWGNQVFNQNNLGNIRCLEGIPCVGGFSQFPSLESFVANAIATWHNGNYTQVLAVANLQVDPYVQITAIGVSPWDAGHYGGAAPGSALIPYFQEVVQLDPVIQAVTDLGNFISQKESAIAAAQTAGNASLAQMHTDEMALLKAIQAGLTSVTAGGLTPTQSATLTHIESMLMNGLKGS